MVWRLTMNIWIANLSCIKTHLFNGHVLDSCCQCYLTCYLHCDRNWFWAASQTTIGPQKHQMQIASFPTTIGRRHKYCMLVFHKVHFYLWLSHSKLTPWLMRVSKTDLSAVVAHSAYSGTRNWCHNDCVHVAKQLYLVISLALLKFHKRFTQSGPKSLDPSSVCCILGLACED